MKQTYIYRITDKRENNSMPARYIYAMNKPSAKRWQVENCPEISAKIECIGIRNTPMGVYAQEFSFAEYQAINKRISNMTDPNFWKNFVNEK